MLSATEDLGAPGRGDLLGRGQILQRPVGVLGCFPPIALVLPPPHDCDRRSSLIFPLGPVLALLWAVLVRSWVRLLPLSCPLLPARWFFGLVLVGLRKGLILALLALSWISCCMRTESRACALSRCKCVRIESRACPSVRPWPCVRCCPRVPFFQTRGGGWCEFGRHGELGKLKPRR